MPNCAKGQPMPAGMAGHAMCIWPKISIFSSSKPCPQRCKRPFQIGGGQSMMIQCLMDQAFACQSCCLAMPPLGCSQRGDIILIPKRPITPPIWCRRIIISGFTYGFVMCGAWMQPCIMASMAIWNGFRARRWRLAMAVIQRRCLGQCP